MRKSMTKFTGIEYIKIDIANQFGLDKINWNNRIEFVNANKDKLETITELANEPILFAKAVRAYRDAQNHIPTGFIMGLDATASGIQIMACLMGCKKTAKRVNLVNTSKREDVYQFVAEKLSKLCGRIFPRSIVKYPCMTTFYGSLQQPKDIFGDNTPELNNFYNILNNELSGAMECMNDMQSCWQSNKKIHQWTLPDGHIAYVKVMVPEDHKIEIDELDHATFTHRIYVNKAQESGLSLAANIIHSVDGYVVREMVRNSKRQGFDLLHIHDSFQ